MNYLKDAFVETLSALDSISEYKQNALPQMKQVIAEFRDLTYEGEKAIQNMEKSDVMRIDYKND